MRLGTSVGFGLISCASVYPMPSSFMHAMISPLLRMGKLYPPAAAMAFQIKNAETEVLLYYRSCTHTLTGDP
jgi:hypothetical protein